MKRMEARINTYVPATLKDRLEALAETSGLKSSDLVRISLSYAIAQFERNGIILDRNTQGGGKLAKGRGR
jgi:hypothetical protein